jgi:hypothetical protein
LGARQKAWEHIEKKWCEFNIEPRHLKLGLATIGVNPYSHFSSKYSTWLICLVNYNLALNLSTKRTFVMLNFIVPNKGQVKNMDVYLKPLFDELKILWNEWVFCTRHVKTQHG